MITRAGFVQQLSLLAARFDADQVEATTYHH
jgi:hypothetical protein